MWAPLAVFVGVVALVIGAYWTLVLREEDKLLDRLKPKPDSSRVLKGVLKAEEKFSSVGPLHAALERAPFVGPLKQLLEQSGTRMNMASFLLLSGCAFFGAYLLGGVLTGIAWIGLAAGVCLAFLPYLFVRRARTKRMLKFEEHFPEAIDLISRALRAGHALPTGLSMVADEMPAPVGTEFRILFDEQNFGLTLPDAMRNFARRVPVLDARFFVTAVLTQREAGGNLSEVLDNLAAVIRERFKVKRQIRVISAHGRITGTVLAFLPPSLAMVTLLINPDHLGTLLHDPIGVRMIYAALGLQVLGTLIMRKIIRIEY
jgi:tight adherence protein B